MKFLSETVLEISLLKNLERQKKGKHKEEQIGESPFAIPRYNLSLWTCIPNMKFLSETVVEISLTNNLERKKKGQTQGRTNRRMPIYNPTIQLVLVDLYTKYEVSILNGCGEIPRDVPIQLEIQKGSKAKCSVHKLRELLNEHIFARERAEQQTMNEIKYTSPKSPRHRDLNTGDIAAFSCDLASQVFYYLHQSLLYYSRLSRYLCLYHHPSDGCVVRFST